MRRRIFMLIIALVIICHCLCSLADEQVNITVATDKKAYVFGEVLIVNLTVQNNSESSLQNVILTNLLPDGCSYIDQKSATTNVSVLKSGETASLKTLFKVTENIPATGDNTHIVLYEILFIGALVFIIVLCLFRRKKGFPLFLMLFSAALICFQPFDAKSETISQETAAVVRINGIATKVISTVSYDIEDDKITYTKPTADHIQYDESSDTVYVDNQFLLMANEGTSREQIEELIKLYGGFIAGEITLTNDYQIQIPGNNTLAQINDIVTKLKGQSVIRDAVVHQLWLSKCDLSSTNDKEYVDNQCSWDLSALPYAYYNWGLISINAMDAWNLCVDNNKGSNVNVGVYDSMFDENHDDLDFLAVHSNADNIPSQVWNEEHKQMEDNSLYQHGSHVAGIVGATFNNNTGISGAAPNAKLYAFSSFGNMPTIDELSADSSWLAKAGLKVYQFANNIGVWFDSTYSKKYGLALLLVKDKCKVVNFSVSSGADDYQEIDTFLSTLVKNGYDFLIIQSAGNDSRIATTKKETATSKKGKTTNFIGYFTKCEKNRDRIIVVGSYAIRNVNMIALDTWNALGIGLNTYSGYKFSNFSNYGSRVDVVAPGESIYSTVPTNRYTSMSGTSQAAPFVTGVAALCYGVNPNLSGPQVKEIIINSAHVLLEDINLGRTEDLHSPLYSYPMLDEYAAVEMALNGSSGSSARKSKGRITAKVYTRTNISSYNYRDTATDDICVVAYRKNGKKYEPVEYSFTWGGGYLDMELEPGEYLIVFNDTTYSGNNYMQTILPSAVITKNNTVDAGNVVLFSSLVNPRNNMTGKVIDKTTSAAIAGVNIELYPGINNFTGQCTNSYRRNDMMRAQTGIGGMFIVSSIPNCEAYTAVFTKPGYQTAYHNVYLGSNEVCQVTMQPIENTPVEDFTFSTKMYEEYGITQQCEVSYYNGNATEIVIPSYDTKGNRVTAVGTWEYSDGSEMIKSKGMGSNSQGKRLTQVVIPDGVQEIRIKAFQNCESLKSIVIPDSVGFIGDKAFQNCKSLESIRLPKSLDNAPSYAFDGCSSLKTVYIPDGIASVSSDMFDGCSSIETIYCKKGSYAWDVFSGTKLKSRLVDWNE